MLTGSEQMRPTSIANDGPTPEQLAAELGKELAGRSRPLPPSSHLKHRRLQMIVPWEERFAARPDWYVNCDASGNTDPRAWEGTKPEQWEGDPQPVAPPVPEGFRPAEPLAIESQSSPLGEFLADTRAGAVQKDNRSSALPVMVSSAPVSQLMAELQEQMICRWEDAS